MYVRDLEISIFNNLLVKYVLFNSSSVDWWMSPNANNSNWVSIGVHQPLSDFNSAAPIDLVITVRGAVSELCPAVLFMDTPQVCEYALHGRDGDYQCCPHGITPPASPPEQCCVDDLNKSPYRMNYISHTPSPQSTDYLFQVVVVKPSDLDYDGLEQAYCDTMSLDWAEIQLFNNVKVLQVTWEERIMPFNYTFATNTSRWLVIYGINQFLADFNPADPIDLVVTVAGWVNEPCPAQATFDAPYVYCEYAFHGTESTYDCCPLGFTGLGNETGTCGCRDDLDQSPYRMGATAVAASSNTTTFNFNLAMVETNWQNDFDGIDYDQGLPVNCTSMNIENIKLAVFPNLEVVDVTFNTAHLSWQWTANNNESNWLWILGVDYAPVDFTLYQPVSVSVTVKGTVTELCPASSVYGSQVSCQYQILGSNASPFYEGCCPTGITAYYSPDRLKALAGYPAPEITSTRH